MAVGTALPAGTSAAHAETAQVTEESNLVGSAETAHPVQAAGWERVNWYFNFNNCTVAGGELDRSDRSVIQYKCEESGGTWYLYVLR
ncbi:hypothetical protein SSPO_007280 [Streptomyces antimycoticus]|uniref:Ricin B lectin domain-containing protein n=1 Tax=Streptomyces antimycoticus TaxID=68175 RepID=A0A499UDU1_9ACTN|nr:hypothetical protein SSPO_007280 [Streptomyces antimycoticus]